MRRLLSAIERFVFKRDPRLSRLLFAKGCDYCGKPDSVFYNGFTGVHECHNCGRTS